MSTQIVTDICPPPEWNLKEEDIHQMVDELKSYYQDFNQPLSAVIRRLMVGCI